jgi:hypothetical protein
MNTGDTMSFALTISYNFNHKISHFAGLYFISACSFLSLCIYLSFLLHHRVGFRNSVNSAEDAKSEVMKLFQESWERDNGYFFTDDLPPTTNYAQDILRNK